MDFASRRRQAGKLLIGVLHLLPLPGAPRKTSTVEEILAHTLAEARIYADAGISWMVVENHGDAPFPAEESAPHVAAIMAVVARAVRESCGATVGVNVLRNDASSALAAAVAGGGDFVRVNVLTGVTATDQGLIEGRAHDVLRYRAQVAPSVAILADVEVKFGTPLYTPSLEVLARATLERGLADGLIVTGEATGAATSVDSLATVRAAVGEAPVFAGSGVDADNVADVLKHADGALVGSTFKEGCDVEAPVSPERVQTFVHAWKSACS